MNKDILSFSKQKLKEIINKNLIKIKELQNKSLNEMLLKNKKIECNCGSELQLLIFETEKLQWELENYEELQNIEKQNEIIIICNNSNRIKETVDCIRKYFVNNLGDK